MDISIGLWGLFISSFLASTLLPGGSEAALLISAHQNLGSPMILLLTATLGNTLGGLSSWGIGRLLRWRFPGLGLEKPEHKRAVEKIGRYGSPILILSWLPVVGDPLCVAAGWSRVSFPASLFFIAVGKLGRYFVLLELAGW